MQLRQMSPNLQKTWGYPIMGGLGVLLGLGWWATDPAAATITLLGSVILGSGRFLLLGATRWWLRRKIIRFTHEQRAELLAMLVDRPEAGEIVVPVLHRLEPRGGRGEVIPASAPPARGDEASPAE